jgi:methionyl-tRNA formyltransferase
VRIAFLGNGAFGIPTFRALAASTHELIALVTRPDRAAGRGQRETASPLKEAADEGEVPVIEIADLQAPDTGPVLSELQCDLWVVVAFPIIPEPLLTIPPEGTINLHASLLPHYRGAAPVQWAIINGEEVTGVTTFFVDAGIDTGAICLQREVVIDEEEHAGELRQRLAEVGAALMRESVDLIAAGTAPRITQDSALATPAPAFTKEEGLIDWNRPASEIRNRIRGLQPWPGSFSSITGERVILLKTRIADRDEWPWGGGEAPPPGTLAGFLPGGEPVVVTGEGDGLVLLEIQREGRRPGTAAAVMRGLRCEPGARFGDER